MKFKAKRPHYEYLRKKWISKHQHAAEKLLSSHQDAVKNVALGGLGGLMMLSNPGVQATMPQPQELTNNNITKEEDKTVLLAKSLEINVPKEMRSLTPEEESKVEGVLADNMGFKVKAELDGVRLNRSYGMIGGEQHLYRYPGDNLYKHADNASDWAMYGGSGIAPGLGAWGYFTSSESNFSAKDKEREKYYLAVPTFLAPGFAENVGKYRDFFKFRKMLVVNPKTGQSVVAVVGDAGPAQWTGKHLGGSPEVMHYLGLAKGPRKGAVVYFFIDDPKDQIPLGPISPKGPSLAKEDNIVTKILARGK